MVLPYKSATIIYYEKIISSSTETLPKHERAELKQVTSIIRELCDDVVMRILFGSFARGDWVEDEYKEGHIIYECKSDFDILVITEGKRPPTTTAYGKK